VNLLVAADAILVERRFFEAGALVAAIALELGDEGLALFGVAGRRLGDRGGLREGGSARGRSGRRCLRALVLATAEAEEEEDQTDNKNERAGHG